MNTVTVTMHFPMVTCSSDESCSCGVVVDVVSIIVDDVVIIVIDVVIVIANVIIIVVIVIVVVVANTGTRKSKR